MPKRPSLLAYAISRLLLAFPMLLILLTVVFAVLRILPGDPIAALYGGSLTLGSAPIGGLRAELALPGV